MPAFHRRSRRIAAALIALSAVLAMAAPLAAAERTIEFRSAERSAEPIDLGLPEPSLGAEGTLRFRWNAQDRKAAAAAKKQERYRDEAARYRDASTEANERIAAIDQLLAAAEEDEAALREEIRARAVERYKDGEAGSLRFLLSGDGLSDLIARGEILKDQSARDSRLLEDYELTVGRIEQYRLVLEELRDITGEQSERLDERAERLDEVLVAARVGHDEAPARLPKGKDKPGVDGTWYVMDGAFQAQLFLPGVASGYTGGNHSPSRKATPAQIQAVLSNTKVDLDSSGINDVLTGQIDGRVLDALLLAAERFGYVKVTSLKRDHGVYTSSGNVSAHAYGCAADIGTIGSTYITPGAQVPGGEVYQAVQFFAALGAVKPDLAPHQVISLFDMGGATLAMGDHGDHIHLGYSC